MVRLNQSEAPVNHSKCLRSALSAVAAVIVLGAFTPADASEIPQVMQGTGFDTAYLFFKEFGPMGLAGYVAWRGAGVAQSIKLPSPLITITIPVTQLVAPAAEPEKKETTP